MNTFQICEELLNQLPEQEKKNLIERWRETNFKIRLNESGTAIEGIRQRNYEEMAKTNTIMDLGEQFYDQLPDNWWDRISIAEKIKLLGLTMGWNDKEIFEELMKRKEMEITEMEKNMMDNGSNNN